MSKQKVARVLVEARVLIGAVCFFKKRQPLIKLSENGMIGQLLSPCGIAPVTGPRWLLRYALSKRGRKRVVVNTD